MAQKNTLLPFPQHSFYNLILLLSPPPLPPTTPFLTSTPPTDPTGRPYLSLYLYESGSPFEDVMNRYMITGLGINAFNPRGFGVEGVVVNSSAVEEQAVLVGDVDAMGEIGLVGASVTGVR